MFRRRRKEQTDLDEDGVAVDTDLETEGDLETDGEIDAGPLEDGVSDGELDPAGGAVPIATPSLRSGPAPDAPEGPFDEGDAPDDDIARVDLGALRVPIVDGVELRLEVNEAGELGQVLLVEGPNIMQIGAFAAPKSSGIWDEVRAEILGSVSTTGGAAEEVEGLYGIELAAHVPTGAPGQLAPARFLGIDRRRWFMRALLTGPAAIDPEAAELLLSVLAGTVVVRGTDAMPIRDPLPLRLPKEAVEAAEAEAAAQGEQDANDLDQLGPGPTITETR
ncbi:MAG TPA: DUF3710 domain-containing protein [Frankiaceae bacterium]|nr:DUF3710 domain-containing protein [Frankiaceae bacterium]